MNQNELISFINISQVTLKLESRMSMGVGVVCQKTKKRGDEIKKFIEEEKAIQGTTEKQERRIG